jgi:hypothetical protein
LAPNAPGDSLRGLAADLPKLSIVNAQSHLPVERGRFAFGLSAEGNQLIERAVPRVWLARDRTSPAEGPSQARWVELRGYGRTHDRSPRGELTGFYVAEVDVPELPGTWLALAIVDLAGRRFAGQGAITVGRQDPPRVGTQAVSRPSPMASGSTELAKICTRAPACPMHAVSMDRALKSGRPTVVSFATPLLSASRMSAPALDEVMVARQRVGDGKANFIHVEIYPQRDIGRPAHLYYDWGLRTEPWTMVVDRDGYIRTMTEGPMTAGEIRTALQPVL